jgi:hypothetical protein
MPDAAPNALYRLRRVLPVAALAAPVVLLLGIWWLVTQVLMVPGVPDEQASGDAVARFIIHANGLPRVDAERRDAFLETQIRRLAQDAAFRERFLAEYRTASPEDQKSFRAHLFDALKPIVFRDIAAYEQQPEGERAAYLDDRIVYYNRVARMWGSTTISKHMLGSGALSPTEALEFVLGRTTKQERGRAVAYGQALAARVEQVLASPELKAAMERRIEAP